MPKNRMPKRAEMVPSHKPGDVEKLTGRYKPSFTMERVKMTPKQRLRARLETKRKPHAKPSQDSDKFM